MAESFLEMGPENMGDWENAHMTEHLRPCAEIEILDIEGHQGNNVEDSYVVPELMCKDN